MSEPIIAGTNFMMVELEPGTYYWCACGRSEKQPFCDGSHQGTEFQPKEFVVEQKKNSAMCLCKHTKNPPFCDGAHTKLDEG